MMFGIKFNDRDIINDLNRKRKYINPLAIVLVSVLLTVSVIICAIVCVKLFSDKDAVQTISENALHTEQAGIVDTPQIQPVMPSFDGLNLLAVTDGIYLDNTNFRVILDKGSIRSREFSVKNDIIKRQCEIELGVGMDDAGLSEQIFEAGRFELVLAEESSLKLAFDRLYLTESDEDDYYYYVNFFDPRERYDKILVLDPGHGGEDAGAIVGEVYEKDIDIKIAKKVYDKFKADPDCGIEVIMTRYDDTFLTLEERVRIANEVGDIFVSIHSNTYEKDTGISGIQTHYLPDYTHLGSELLATNIQKNVVELTGARDRGIDSTNSFYVVNHTLMPSSLIETGYMTNPDELQKLLDDEYLEKIAEGIYRGIVESCENVNFRDKDFFNEIFYN